MIIIIKLLPWLLIGYGFWDGYSAYEESLVKAEELESELSGSQSKLVKLEKAIKDIESYYSDIEAEKNKMEKISKEFEVVQKKLPEKQDDKENFYLFEEIARKVLMKEIKVSPGVDKSRSGYIEKSYTINAKGTYLQFLLYFELLYKRERLFDIKNILLRTKTAEERGRFQVVDGQFDIKTYVYNAAFDEKGADDKAE